MGPPPRPPIICYDLHTEANARQITCQRVSTGARSTRPRLTVIRKEPNELLNAQSKPTWNQIDEPSSACARTVTRKFKPDFQFSSNKSTQRYEQNLVDLQLSRFRPGLFEPINRSNELAKREKLERQNAQLAYSNRLKHEAELKEQRIRNRREKLARLRELDEVSLKLEAIRKVQENLRETYGLSHRAAKYLQKQDEENAKLKQKMEKFSEVRSRELGSRIRQMKRFQALTKQHSDRNSETDENCPISNDNNPACKSTSPIKMSVSSDSAHHSTGQPSSPSASSTISISSFSSLSSDDLIAMGHLVKPSSKITSKTNQPPVLTSSFSKRYIQETQPLKLSTPKSTRRLSFFKRNAPVHHETLEITDLDFFDKVEDRTMLEVNQLMNNLHAQLRE